MQARQIQLPDSTRTRDFRRRFPFTALAQCTFLLSVGLQCLQPAPIDTPQTQCHVVAAQQLVGGVEVDVVHFHLRRSNIGQQGAALQEADVLWVQLKLELGFG